MKVILWMAMSANGIIARENNKEDFISHDSWEEWLKWIKESGCVIWGRKTHEVVKTWGNQYLEDIKDVKVIVISKNPKYETTKGFELSVSPRESLEKLKAQGFKTVVVTGGSTLNSSFAKERLIDEIVLNIEPVVIGKGISLFSPEQFDLKLELLGKKHLQNGIVQLHYKIKK